MEARNKGDNLLVIRETKMNADSQKYKTEINIKDRMPVLIMDGGIQLLMRQLIVNNFWGDFEYYTINVYGKVLRGVITVKKERKKVRIFYRSFTDVIVVKNLKYFNDVVEESSETYFTSNGKIVLHFWPRYNYLLHAIRSPPKPKERILPKLELMWKTDNLLFKHYQKKKKLTLENAMSYLQSHPEVVDFIYDYVHSLLQKKPEVVFPFTVKYFQNMKNTY
ncbi:ciliogenesis-associated TTC17-interacting protein isoform X1 [Ceratitis capitata]|uniref:ciliogenesis-associated TTC17-interacting protein isoform X1 n=1 Tax=Ceratitis capitata TaxID=7213 RepID=UPI000329ACE4|nr:ciliogenesis-associated TTC17-interacting protein isoform X1 [Ceratitis capitata]